MARKPVSMLATFTEDGRILPDTLIWTDEYNDEHKYKIERITEIRKASSTKAGGSGMRYTCEVNDKRTYLYLDNDIWYIEY